MIEIVMLYFLAKRIGNIAANKGLQPNSWKWKLVLFWILAEITGAGIGILIFGINNRFSCLLLAIGFAFSSYYLLKNYLEKLPNK